MKISLLHKLIFTLLLMISLLEFLPAQESADKVHDLVEHTEQIYSTDDLLVNGQIYSSERSLAKGSPYFGENEFSKGKVIIKGRKFDGVLLKYNLVDQRLLLRAAVESGRYVTILLNSNLVDAFTMDDQSFINADNYFDEADISGFYTLVYEGSFACLVNYEKTFRAVYDTQTPNGSFTEASVKYFLLDEGKTINISKKKVLLKHFPVMKKEVKSFIRKNKINYKKASLLSLNKIMKYCDSISETK